LSQFQQGLREAGFILLTACVLGFSYTATFKKGIFAESNLNSPARAPASANQLPMINLAEATGLFDAGQTVFIDARHEFDYKLGHIKGAVNIPLKDYEAYRDSLAAYSKDKSMVAYCDGAECNSSIELSAKLLAAGYTNVKIFYGGWKEWTGGKLPTKKSPR
jgi:rhodanese-related sulfurtransferase